MSKGTIIYKIDRRAKQRAVDLVGKLVNDLRTGLEGASSEVDGPEVEEQDMQALPEELRFFVCTEPALHGDSAHHVATHRGLARCVWLLE